MNGWIQTGIGFVLGALVTALVFFIQESRAKRSFEALVRFLENVAANRHNGAEITFKGGTTVRPGTGELKVEGFAPTVTVSKAPPKREA